MGQMASTFAFSRFRTKTVLLVGAGGAAAALVLRLVEGGARVRWLSQDADVAEEIWRSRRPDRIEIGLRAPRALDVAEAAAVIVTAGEPIARRVADEARALGRPVAVLGRPDLSTFDLDDIDDGGSGDVAPWPPRLGAPLRRATAWLSARLSRATTVLESLPGTFGV
jgi:hypothetical protein